MSVLYCCLACMYCVDKENKCGLLSIIVVRKDVVAKDFLRVFSRHLCKELNQRSKLTTHKAQLRRSNDVIDSTSCQEGIASIRQPAALLTVGKLPL